MLFRFARLIGRTGFGHVASQIRVSVFCLVIGCFCFMISFRARNLRGSLVFEATEAILNYARAYKSSYKSLHSGFIASINCIFFALEPAFICFSLARAAIMLLNSSYQTNLLRLYRAEKEFLYFLFLWLCVRYFSSEVTPVYITPFGLLVVM